MPPQVSVTLDNPQQLTRGTLGVVVKSTGAVQNGVPPYTGWTVTYSTNDGNLPSWQGLQAGVQSDGTFSAQVNTAYGNGGRILVQVYDGNGVYQCTSEQRDVNSTPKQ